MTSRRQPRSEATSRSPRASFLRSRCVASTSGAISTACATRRSSSVSRFARACSSGVGRPSSRCTSPSAESRAACASASRISPPSLSTAPSG
ncbi:MAG: hypothetical protein ACK52I_24765, partial [Pseudomonadota bacterium]